MLVLICAEDGGAGWASGTCRPGKAPRPRNARDQEPWFSLQGGFAQFTSHVSSLSSASDICMAFEACTLVRKESEENYLYSAQF